MSTFNAMPHPELVVFFLLIAFVYASVGFGGGSSYLAILTFYSFPFRELRLIALICNIIVVTGGTIIFIRNGQVNAKKILPLVMVSAPLAFLGASLKISQQTFFVVLGLALIVAAVLLWINAPPAKKIEEANGKSTLLQNIFLGGAIGFLSGMVGIGGGIFLSPILNLMKWDTPKRVAATASIYILLNSLSGIAGQVYQLPANLNYIQIIILAAAVLVGGQLGSRMAAQKFNQVVIKKITSVLVLIAGLEVLYHHLPLFK
jgi:uncharacterized protein